MRTEDIFALGLGLTPPWQVLSQRLDTEKAPHGRGFVPYRWSDGSRSQGQYPAVPPEATPHHSRNRSPAAAGRRPDLRQRLGQRLGQRDNACGNAFDSPLSFDFDNGFDSAFDNDFDNALGSAFDNANR